MLRDLCLSIIAVCALFACWTVAPEYRNELHDQAVALQSIAESLKHPAPQSDECHETLQLFDEMLRHEIRHGGK